MLMIVVTIVSAITLTLAQPSNPGLCNETSNDLFGNENRSPTTCGAAYLALRSRNATGEQSMMVCNTNHECNSMIENFTILCSNIQMSTSGFPTLDHLCTNGSNGVVNDCLSKFSAAMTNDTVNAALMAVTTNCGTCNETCRQNLMVLVNTFECCSAEELQTQIRSANESIENSVTNALETCGLPLQSCNNGSNLPSQNTSSSCTNATNNLFSRNDECSRAVQELFDGGNNGSSMTPMISHIFNGDCPAWLYSYATLCRMDDDRFLQVASTILSISQAGASNGRRCSEFVLVFQQAYDNGITCTSDYLKNQCSNTCKQILMNWTAQYGCCFNSIVGEFIGRSNVFHEQIDYAILTRDIYSLCGISSGGFCAEINQPSYTTAVEQCINARNLFFSDSTCLNHYLIFDRRSSAIVVNSTATAICESQRCKNRMSAYIDFLITCQRRSLEDDKDDDEDDNNYQEGYIGYLDLAYLIGNTTCRVDSANNTCYSSVFSSQQYAMVAAALDTNNSNAECVMSTQVTCPSACMQLIAEAIDSVGCCLGEYSRALLGDEFTDTVLTTCNETLNVRCTEIQAVQDVDDDNHDVGAGVNVQKGLGVLAILLHGMITTWLLF